MCLVFISLQLGILNGRYNAVHYSNYHGSCCRVCDQVVVSMVVVFCYFKADMTQIYFSKLHCNIMMLVMWLFCMVHVVLQSVSVNNTFGIVVQPRINPEWTDVSLNAFHLCLSYLILFLIFQTRKWHSCWWPIKSPNKVEVVLWCHVSSTHVGAT